MYTRSSCMHLLPQIKKSFIRNAAQGLRKSYAIPLRRILQWSCTLLVPLALPKAGAVLDTDERLGLCQCQSSEIYKLFSPRDNFKNFQVQISDLQQNYGDLIKPEYFLLRGQCVPHLAEVSCWHMPTSPPLLRGPVTPLMAWSLPGTLRETSTLKGMQGPWNGVQYWWIFFFKQGKMVRWNVQFKTWSCKVLQLNLCNNSKTPETTSVSRISRFVNS